MRWLESARARLRLLWGRGAERRMEEEIRFHLEMEADRLVREEGLSPAEARRRARVAFGGVERTKEELRSERGLAWLSGLRLDFKLGARMLTKYPVLTASSVLALAIAVALATSWFEFMTDLVAPRLPLEEGDRVVAVRNRDLATAETESRSLRDFETWRAELKSLEQLSAGSPVEYSARTADDRFASLEGMKVTASLFPLTRVRPVLGREFLPDDFERTAEPVAVLGYDAWQRLYDGDRSVIGQTVWLGGDAATIVGVMPEGFEFPMNEEVWTPLRERGVDFGPREGPRIITFARLAPGYSLDEARAELAVIGERTAAANPATHEHVRPRVTRFGRGNDMAVAAMVLNVPFFLFLVVVSANVATLLFARTSTRESELAMRAALGASRRRIVLQLVAEALVLTVLGAALGLAMASWGLGWGMELFWQVQQMRPPFWFDSGLSPTTVLYVVALAGLGALIIGTLPALRATRRQLRGRLHQTGSPGTKFGAIATGVIVVQVALCVAFIPIAILNARDLLPEAEDGSFPADAYLTARITRQTADAGPAGAGAAEPGGALDELRRRMEAEPGVLAVTRASRLPGFNHGIEAVAVEGISGRVLEGRRVAVDPNFFDVMGGRVVRGRPFAESDVTGDARVVIVDGSWARQTFGGQNPVGRRIRFPRREGADEVPWSEVVGVVEEIDRAVGVGEPIAVYEPLRAGEHASMQVYLRTEGPPAAYSARIQSLVAAVDPSLGVAELGSLAETWGPVRRANRFFAAALAVVSAVILLFGLIGIYALMSFTVAQRAREIGIRAALGADRRRILVSIFSRAAAQIGVGILAGGALVSLTVLDSAAEIRLVGGVAAAMAVVGLVGCVVPAARALRIQPVEALRSE